MRIAALTALLVALLAGAGVSLAQSLYKYRGENGEWIYSDRPPPDGATADEVRNLKSGASRGRVTVQVQSAGRRVNVVGRNLFHAPVEIAIRFKRLQGLELPDPEDDLTWVLPPLASSTLLSMAMRTDGSVPSAEYEYEYIVGDPESVHKPASLYRVPYAIATDFTITQAYPDVITHRTADSHHAVDIAMPIGTDIFAARAGTVFDVSSNNYKGGLDPREQGGDANVVQILHDDGTFAIYAHLNWNSIRVRPGDRVTRGQYIADSGNTGFSSGPHLHFAVLRNVGMFLESVPVRFEGADSRPVVPATGRLLMAY